MIYKPKYLSRKFICAILNAIINLIVCFTTESISVKVVAITLIALGFIAFIVAESIIDAAHIAPAADPEPKETVDTPVIGFEVTNEDEEYDDE